MGETDFVVYLESASAKCNGLFISNGEFVLREEVAQTFWTGGTV
jgi:hypothetical protein